jgi:thymidylate synthase
MNPLFNNEKVLLELADSILNGGGKISPRGLESRERLGVMLAVSSIRHRSIGYRSIGCNPIFPYIEGLWILLGEENPERLLDYSLYPSRFINENISPNLGEAFKRLDGAYGPRIRHAGPVQRSPFGGNPTVDQLEIVYRRLRDDPDTRRAVITISNPILDWNDRSLDIPCTQTFQFLIRHNKLYMMTTMRSQDLIKGFPNDLTEFQWFQEILAGWLNIEVGPYAHFVGSLHIYETEYKATLDMLKDENSFSMYSGIIPLDARVNKLEFKGILNTLDLIERKSVTDAPTALSIYHGLDHVSRWPEFYQRLAKVIIAVNLTKQGEIKLAKRLVSNKKTELEYYYWNRWNQK